MTTTAAKRNTSYDEVMYESNTYFQTQPPHLFTIARLFGLHPPALETAKVLELGCASGGNLFSLALAYPDAHFTGIDLSEKQIALAEDNRVSLGLENVTFQQEDIMKFDLDANAGAFDYIICHGVYSWVPEDVREKILELCARCLSPDGLTLISYNTLPGWNMVRSLREMMLFHTSEIHKPEEKISQAKTFLEFLAENTQVDSYKSIIEEELKSLNNKNDTFLFHDHLEENNNQFYFHEFASAAERHSLAYVGDSDLATMFVGNLPQQAMEKLKMINNIIHQEQYVDFLQNRRFRNSIICRAGRTINRSLDPDIIFDFHLASNMRLKDSDSGAEHAVFESDFGQFTTNNEMSRALFMELIETRKPIHAQDLLERARIRIGIDSTLPLKRFLVENGLLMIFRGFITLNVAPLPFTETVGERPQAFPLARIQAQNTQTRGVTNALHRMIKTSLVTNLILARLDGTVTVSEIIADLTNRSLKGELAMRIAGTTLTDHNAIHAEVQTQVANILKILADNALLVG